MEETAESLKKALEKVGADTHGRMDKSVEDTRNAVRNHPMAAVGTTLAAGVVVGAVMGAVVGRRSKKGKARAA